MFFSRAPMSFKMDKDSLRMCFVFYGRPPSKKKNHFLWFRISTVLNYFVHTSDNRYIRKISEWKLKTNSMESGNHILHIKYRIWVDLRCGVQHHIYTDHCPYDPSLVYQKILLDYKMLKSLMTKCEWLIT